MAVAEQLVEHHADGEQVGRDVPPGEVRVGWLVGRRARTRPYLIADPGSDVEVQQFRSGPGEHHVERLDVAVDQPFVRQIPPLGELRLGQLAVAAYRVQLAEALRIWMKSDQRVEQVESDIDRLPVAEDPAAADELTQWLTLDELGDEVPVAGAGPARPVDLHHVRMTDLAQSADLAAHRRIAGRVVEELERPLLLLDLVAYPVDLRKPASPEDVQDLEAVVDDIADSVVSGLDPDRRSQLCCVRARQRVAVPAESARPRPREDPPGA